MTITPDFFSDIKELVKVNISSEAFRSICRSPRVSELEWALSYVYDHWNFEKGDNHLKRYIDVLEQEIRLRDMF